MSTLLYRSRRDRRRDLTQALFILLLTVGTIVFQIVAIGKITSPHTNVHDQIVWAYLSIGNMLGVIASRQGR